MKPAILIYFGILMVLLVNCAPMEKIAMHDFGSGYYKLRTRDNILSEVYVSVTEDSILVYPAITDQKNVSVDTAYRRAASIISILPGNDFYESCFIKKSVDIDLATILLKYRPPSGEVPNQLNANLNAALYVGFRKDFYKMVTNTSPLKEKSSNCRHTAFDLGLFAGIGITQINPTVTGNEVALEYDGIVLQKGIGAFLTFGRMSVGMILGFDNLMDKNKTVWLYNQKPYLGLSIGIANF